MTFPESATYIAFGFSFVITLLAMVFSGHLWKIRFFRKFLYPSLVSAVMGVILEFTKYLNQKVGLTAIVMLVPLFYLFNFQFCRSIFKKYIGSEPYVTSSGSRVGSPPLDLFTSENIDGKDRKHNKDRRILTADFVFSFATHLFPALVILWAVYLTRN